VDFPDIPIDSFPHDPTVAVSGNLALLGVATDDGDWNGAPRRAFRLE
jgi:hypothetical protein